MVRKIGFLVLFGFLLGFCASFSASAEEREWLIIGHRGACGHIPEHTLASYALAIEMGADFVEPDVVSTRDGILICRHDCELGSTTDAAVKFPERKKTVVIDGKEMTGWFAEDFTLAEIKSLRAKERLEFRDHSRDGLYEVPTLQEVFSLVKEKSREKGREIGIYPETKHPSYHDALGLSLEEPLVELLKQNGYASPSDPVIIQSFEIANLKELHDKTRLRLVQLFDEFHLQPGCLLAAGKPGTYKDMATSEGLNEIASYAYGIGPWKETIMPRDKNNHLQKPSSLIEDAHKAGLKVHIYTMRNEKSYLAEEYAGDPREEYRAWIRMGVDGFFTDYPDTAIQVRDELR
ncbi:MAG TPA: glycerophosphodiester phosphodiesterase [Synergistaceae bacterium]|nr:glycerophosphodiester phosphodiesterase [Synergistaceae bacterium]HPJ25435.1 glycerophosphodiester phosphodiesterase [Synergistaceae bacterium]HPQ37128.1 glycerophosphodiester phosphodiesterase [Synergistaceae bacterium]